MGIRPSDDSLAMQASAHKALIELLAYESHFHMTNEV